MNELTNTLHGLGGCSRRTDRTDHPVDHAGTHRAAVDRMSLFSVVGRNLEVHLHIEVHVAGSRTLVEVGTLGRTGVDIDCMGLTWWFQ